MMGLDHVQNATLGIGPIFYMSGEFGYTIPKKKYGV